ncbi:DUF2274 domain-containing protein [Henriciella mobilis]|jgi:hypothetical protein|uniref:DUF2274 domain-containing protein n=1 Tax=Hyphomonas oceanitis SCH89 TaxID=1280953 RepID=A0A059G3Q8_9PROT|nr:MULTISPECIES: DUF2274 domain-containing protein [Hyphomonadaceae]KDA01215.1 hypothetical protein HOC_16643 [Hyphomonas oceanitis SCH89]RIJ15812.1 DUF2274 domain-containing protein [Henriciella mobilis]RIJ22786.1 DUF2274 domain-containing protein [Henriciella mobilis]|tara:strand:+ start:529 stop:747 length:219 start_codon:yes stop_codon:yes gene_type:complete
MSEVSLKIGPLPDRTPQKLAVLVDPALATELEDYARIHSEIHGVEVPASALVPLMLETFLASDTGFRKAKKS